MFKLSTQEQLVNFYRDNVGQNIILNETNPSYGLVQGGMKAISETQLNLLKNASEILYEFNLFRRKKEEIEMNYDSIVNFPQEWKEKLKSATGQDSTHLQEPAFIDCNRRLTNFLASLKTLIYDIIHIKYIGSELYGRESAEFEQYKERTKAWFDGHFAYRFFIRLRDYSIHSAMPIQIVHFSYDYDEGRNEKINVEIETKFRKSTFLASTKFNALRQDFESYNDTFPLWPILRDIKPIFEQILDAIVLVTEDRYITAAETIYNLVSDIPNPVTLSFGTIVQNSDTEYGVHSEIISVSSINKIFEIRERLT